MDIRFAPTPLPGAVPIYLPYDAERTDSYSANIARGDWSFEEASLFVRNVLQREANPGRSFYDIGANCGTFTLLVASAGIATVAVEALADNYVLLTAAVAKNKLRNVHPHLAAASDRLGILHMIGTSAWGQVASEGLPVAAISLDHIFAISEIQPPALIKIDVEGHELAVLQGTVNLIDSVPDVDFLVEVFPDNKASLEFLEERGYHCYMLKMQSMIPTRSTDFLESQVTDFFCTRRHIVGDTFAGTAVLQRTDEVSIALLAEEARAPFLAHRLSIARRFKDAPPRLMALPAVRQMIDELAADPDEQVREAISAWRSAA